MAVYAQDIGTVIVFEVDDLDISQAAGALTIRRESPDGQVATWTPTITDGPGGVCTYTTTSSNDLPGPGTYRFQGRWVPDGTSNLHKTGIGTLEVGDPV